MLILCRLIDADDHWVHNNRNFLSSVCLTVTVGEPDAENPHVRFDERGWDTERCRMA